MTRVANAMHWLQWSESGPIKMKPREFLSDNWVQLSLGPNRNSYDPFGQLQTDQLFAAKPIQIICLLIKMEFNWAGLWSVAGHWPKYLAAKLWFGVSSFQICIYYSYMIHKWSTTSFHIEMVANSLFDVCQLGSNLLIKVGSDLTSMQRSKEGQYQS